jgi:hypothetical protein
VIVIELSSLGVVGCVAVINVFADCVVVGRVCRVVVGRTAMVTDVYCDDSIILLLLGVFWCVCSCCIGVTIEVVLWGWSCDQKILVLGMLGVQFNCWVS